MFSWALPGLEAVASPPAASSVAATALSGLWLVVLPLACLCTSGQMDGSRFLRTIIGVFRTRGKQRGLWPCPERVGVLLSILPATTHHGTGERPGRTCGRPEGDGMCLRPGRQALNEAVEVIAVGRVASTPGWCGFRCSVLHKALICDTLRTTFAAQEDWLDRL